MLIDLIRHGEPEGGRKYRGSGIDDPLSARGWTQMRAAVAEAPGWTRIISSPMRRCVDFAQELSAQRALPLRIEERVREMAFGAWEGCRPQALAESDAAAYQAFYRDPVNALPSGAEPLDRLLARVAAVLAEIAACPTAEYPLIIAHGGVIRAAVAWTTGMPVSHMFRLQLDYAEVSRLRVDAQGLPRLVFHARRWP